MRASLTRIAHTTKLPFLRQALRLQRLKNKRTQDTTEHVLLLYLHWPWYAVVFFSYLGCL
jgi:hypothetical protein